MLNQIIVISNIKRNLLSQNGGLLYSILLRLIGPVERPGRQTNLLLVCRQTSVFRKSPSYHEEVAGFNGGS